MSLDRMRDRVRSSTTDQLYTVKDTSKLTIDDVIKSVAVVDSSHAYFDKFALLPLINRPEGPRFKVTKDGTNYFVNVGFVASGTYLDFNNDLGVQESDVPVEGVIYLPIVGSQYTWRVGRHGRGRTGPSQRRAYGLQDLQEAMPVCYAMIKGGTWIKKGVHMKKDNSYLDFFFHAIKDQIIADHIWPRGVTR